MLLITPVAALLAALALAIGLGGCSGRGSATGRAASGGESAFEGAALPAGVRAPNFTLVDQRGRAVSLARQRGRVTLVTFLYAGCTACVLAAQQIRGALDALARPVTVLLISAAPAADTPARVTRFLAAVSLAGRVEYLTGPRRELRAAWRAYRVVAAEGDRAAFERSITVTLVDRHARERVLFGLEQLTPEALAHDIRRLQAG
jgi:cytochrome oxidase Cu insertion factor (SCO1/SenC/PrrC family)